MTNDQQKLIESLNAKIDFNHPIYLWELLLCVKYILQEGNVFITKQFQPYKLPDLSSSIGICSALNVTLQNLYYVQNNRNASYLKIKYDAAQGRRQIMNILAKVYSKIYSMTPPGEYHYWFATTEDRLKFLDIAIEAFKNSQECYISKGRLYINENIICS